MAAVGRAPWPPLAVSALVVVSCHECLDCLSDTSIYPPPLANQWPWLWLWLWFWGGGGGCGRSNTACWCWGGISNGPASQYSNAPSPIMGTDTHKTMPMNSKPQTDKKPIMRKSRAPGRTSRKAATKNKGGSKRSMARNGNEIRTRMRHMRMTMAPRRQPSLASPIAFWPAVATFVHFQWLSSWLCSVCRVRYYIATLLDAVCQYGV